MKLLKLNSIEYKKQPNFKLIFGVAPTNFGNSLVALRGDTVCYLTFFDGKPPLENLFKVWPETSLTRDDKEVAKKMKKIFTADSNGDDVTVCLKGTQFELQVWEAMVNIKKGTTVSYEGLAVSIGRPTAVRAVARCCGKNSVSYFVPCHRVISKSGDLHRFGSGLHRKFQMLKAENAI